MKKIWILLTCLIMALALLWAVGQFSTFRNPISQNFPLRPLWETRLNENIVGLSVANEKMILVRTSKSLNALDVQSGNIIWRQNLSWQADPRPAVISNDIVYVADGNSLLAINQEDGSVLWQHSTGYSNSWVTYASGGIVIANQVGVDILVFDSQNGTLLWRKPVCRGFIQAFAYAQNVYIPCDELEAVAITSGKTVSKEELGIMNSIGYSEGIVYYFSSSVKAYDLPSREILWDTGLSKDGLDNITTIRGLLFYTDASKICRLNVSDGQLNWCANILYPQSPTVIGNTAYIFDGNHKTVTAIKASDGKKLGTLNLSNLNYFIVDRQLLDSTEDLLFISNGKIIYAYTN